MAAKQRERLLIGLAIGCVGLYLANMLVIEPLTARWTANSKAIAARQLDLTRAHNLIDRQQQIKATWNEYKERSLPRDKAAASDEMLNAVGNWMTASRLTATSTQPRWIQDDDKADKLEVRVSADGSLASIVRFVYELEHSNIAVNLEDFQLRSRNDTGKELTMTVRFTGLILPEATKS